MAGGAPPAAPELLVARTVRDACDDLERIDDPLQAELYVSQLLGSWWGTATSDADPEVVLGDAVVARAARGRRPASSALLRCIAALGTPAQRAAAAAAAEQLARRGVPEPDWGDVLGSERVTSVWGYGDVYGDQTSVLLGIERAGAEHGVVVLVDHTLGGIAKDAFVTAEVAGVVADIRGLADPGMWVRELTPQAAAALLYPALAASDAAVDPPVNEDFRAFRALAAARVRLLDEPPPAAEPPPVDAAQRRRIVAEFLGSDAGRGLPEAARRCVETIVDFGCEVDGGQPLRVSPAKIERLLAERFAGAATDVAAALPATLVAWTDWAVRSGGLPAEAAGEVRSAAADLAEAFEHGAFEPGIIPADPDPADEVEAYLAGVDLDELDPEDLPELIARRHFAVPTSGTRIGDEDFVHLDPGDPGERALLIQGEHPEYHDALFDPDSDAVDGVNPRLHLAVHEIVANQLWDDDPPEAWQAAQRLLAGGADRHDVLHMLGEVVTRHLFGALTGGDVDLDAYRADLAALGAPPHPGGGPRRSRRRRSR